MEFLVDRLRDVLSLSKDQTVGVLLCLVCVLVAVGYVGS